MVFTINEMGDIPFFCPATYPYTLPIIRTACQIRAANLFLLWIIPGLSVIILISASCILLLSKTKETEFSDLF